MTTRLFDLNIEEILDNWETHHAIREVIANALDEQILSKSPEIKIFKDHEGNWRIRDFGRGIRIEHFTLNEDKEKLDYPSGIIGKFGVGLKDALATFGRHNINILMQSKWGEYYLREAQKHGFDNITTLHIQYSDKPINIQGTDVILTGVTDADMALAKSMFLVFSNELIIETTPYGQIIQKKDDAARVYINGVLANEEPNFLFSYNITSLTDSMKKRLNRERLNVGRSTYTERVKAILKSAKSKDVQDMLADQVLKRGAGDQCDEMQWLEISQLAFNYLHSKRQVTFVTETELQKRPDIINNIRSDGFAPIVVSDIHKQKLDDQIRSGGIQVRTVETYVRDFNQSFQYSFVDRSRLTDRERTVFDLTPRILTLISVPGKTAPPVKISETLRITTDNTNGVWDPELGAIVIHRRQLASTEGFAGTLLHELAHAWTNLPDLSTAFEQALTSFLGKIAIKAIESK